MYFKKVFNEFRSCFCQKLDFFFFGSYNFITLFFNAFIEILLWW